MVRAVGDLESTEVRTGSPLLLVVTVRELWPFTSNSMFSPPATGSRSSEIVGAYAIAVPVAAHIPGWGLKFITVSARETEAFRNRPTTVGCSFSAILGDVLESLGKRGCDDR